VFVIGDDKLCREQKYMKYQNKPISATSVLMKNGTRSRRETPADHNVIH
jgi:hypothetical protein